MGDDPSVRRRRSSLAKWLFLPVLAAVIYLSHPLWLPQLGAFLVSAEPPQPAEIAVVLAGDGYGHRILKAVECVKQGYVKHVLVDGPRGFYGFDESRLAIEFAVGRGAPRDIFTPLPMRSRSTLDEARTVDTELRRRGLRTALIVTSNFHTRRSRSILARVGSPGIRYIVVAAPDEDFEPQTWWRSRDAEKVVFFEYAKLVNWWLVGDK